MTKEDIESQGWVYREDSFHIRMVEKGQVYEPTHLSMTKNNHSMHYTIGSDRIQIEHCDPNFRTTFPNIVYTGMCWTIEDLQMLERLLQV